MEQYKRIMHNISEIWGYRIAHAVDLQSARITRSDGLHAKNQAKTTRIRDRSSWVFQKKCHKNRIEDQSKWNLVKLLLRTKSMQGSLNTTNFLANKLMQSHASIHTLIYNHINTSVNHIPWKKLHNVCPRTEIRVNHYS
jgi:hypothetical protein